MIHLTRLRLIATGGAAAVLAVGVMTAAVAQPTPARAAISGTHPTWATGAAKVRSSAVTSGTVTANVYLAEGFWVRNGRLSAAQHCPMWA